MIICITGIDGSGKGTQIDLLERHLRKIGKRVFYSKAYGNAEKELLAPLIENATPTEILFIFQALHARQRHAAVEAEKTDHIVIADRWDESYFAYHSQFGVLKDKPDLRETLNDMAFGGIMPDITIALAVNVGGAMERTAIRGRDYFDRHGHEYHEAMQNGILALAAKRAGIVINGNKPALDIHKEIIARLSKKGVC